MISAAYEPLIAVVFTVIFIVLVRARQEQEGSKGGRQRYGQGNFGIFDGRLVFCIVLVVPVMTHAWHIMFGEGSIADYGGTTLFSIFAIDSADWIITTNLMQDGIGLDGALLNTYEVTTALYMLVAYSLVHLHYKDSRWLVNPTSGFRDGPWPGCIFIIFIFISYAFIPWPSEAWVWVDIFWFFECLYVLVRVW